MGVTYGSGSGGSDYYVVEVRNSVSSVKPVLHIAGMEIGCEWRRFSVRAGMEFGHSIKIPMLADGLNPTAQTLGLMKHEAAIALAHALLCYPEQDDPYPFYASIGLEVRIVKVHMKYSYSTEEVGVGATWDSRTFARQPFTPRDAMPVSQSDAKPEA